MAIAAWPTSGQQVGIGNPQQVQQPNYQQQLGSALGGLTNSFGGLNTNAGGVAQTQNLANQGTALFNAGLNRANTTTPWGTQSYSTTIDPRTGMPVANQNVSLDPTLQAAQTQAQSNALGAVQHPLGQTPIGGLTSNVNQSMGDPAIQNAISSQFNAQMGLLQPTFGIQSEQLNAQLANQGLQPGSEAYNNAKNLLSQQQNNAYTQVANNATQQGMGYQNQMFGQQLSNANLNNQAQQQQLGMNVTQANQPLNQYLALNSGSQVNAPNMSQSNAVPTDVLGAAQLGAQGNLNSYNAQTGNQNALMSGLYGLGGAGLNAYATNPGAFNSLYNSIFG